MLEMIEEIKLFLCTAYGNSKEFVGSTINVKIQGLEQGNSTALAGWCVISISILCAHCSIEYGTHFLALYTMVQAQLLTILYLDDTDILHLIMDQEESVLNVHWELQESLLS
jgi:hypothetical protein